MSETTKPAHTPGPWEWDVKIARSGVAYNHVRLATPDRGRLTVLDSVRMGMDGAQLRFRVGAWMHNVIPDLACDQDHNGVARLVHPDALLISAAPDLFAALDVALAGLQVIRRTRADARDDAQRAAVAELDRIITTSKAALSKARGESPDRGNRARGK